MKLNSLSILPDRIWQSVTPLSRIIRLAFLDFPLRNPICVDHGYEPACTLAGTIMEKESSQEASELLMITTERRRRFASADKLAVS